MTKTVLKEIIIILLLCLAIMLLLGILLYEYVPMSKTLPNPVSYATPDNVKQELAEAGEVDQDQIIMTYEVDSTDLNNYKTTQNYKPGKANPFSSYEAAGENTTQGASTTGGNGSTNTGANTNNNAGTSTTNNGSSQENTTTSGGKFFQDKGTK